MRPDGVGGAGAARTLPDGPGGWTVLLAIALSTMLVMGSTQYGFGLFVKPVGAELGLGRAQVNTGAAMMSLCAGLLAPLIGRLIDRWPPQRVVLLGTALFVSGLVTIATAHAIPLMLAAILPVAAGMNMAGTLMANTLAARWFVARRGRAMVVAAIAASAGGAVVVPLIGQLIAAVGWRRSLLIEAAIAGVIVTLLALMAIRDPAGRVSSAATSRASDGDARIWTVAALLRARNFWLLAIGIGLVFGVDAALLTSLVPYGTDRGFSATAATWLVSCLTASAIAGKLVIATVIDRLDRRLLLAVVIAFNLIFVSALLLDLDYTALITACCIVGLSVGGTAPLWYALAADCFGQRSYGTVLGLMNLVVMLFTVAAIRFVGEVFDRTGSYHLAFELFLGASALSTLSIAGLRPPKPSAANQSMGSS